ncbi:hypothetical protein [Rubellicoccus peritrichatus]|uniref:Uncharacterized protein n=1 Tax=Rubellicoccus peritrichatus TaxID=3080537 RepID=A0AAQ3QUA6_9BACT|nr:hypothetical protein [Puniceicoccus sp. CR14]WOO39452.1 hypothetical protein RZN69_12580 [Puniceicoccus sp. CR14]
MDELMRARESADWSDVGDPSRNEIVCGSAQRPRWACAETTCLPIPMLYARRGRRALP